MQLEGDIPCFRIFAGTLYNNIDFQRWLVANYRQGLATWHVGGREDIGECSDLFVLYDNGEGPESPSNPTGMPESCWSTLCSFCRSNNITYAILWLLPYPSPDEEIT